MLESYFKSRNYINDLRKEPFGNCLDGFASELQRLGYSRRFGRRILWNIGRFNRYARRVSLRDPERLDEKLLSGFLKKRSTTDYMLSDNRRAIKHFLKYLERDDLLKRPNPCQRDGRFGQLLSRYDAHLLDVRGLAPYTRESYLRGASHLHDWLKRRYKNKSIEELTGADILEFITQSMEVHSSPSWRRNIGGQTRGFLRYLQWEGIIKNDLARVVPSVPCRRLSSIPRHLCWNQVRKLIASVKTDSAIGKRDKAMLLLFAMLGLRNQEVRKLRLNDIDWRSGKIHLLKTKNYRERILPLTQEVGDALADYLLNGRPHSNVPNVFLRHLTPVGAITSTHGVGDVVERHLKQAGIQSPSYGAHILRHSLATHMVNREVPIKHIADVLGHASIDTTAIYTKVNRTQLATVAMPFPGGAS